MTLAVGRRAVAFGLMLGAASLPPACAAPTEIRLRVRTNMPCTDATKWRGVAIYAGAPGAGLEGKAPTLITQECDAAGLVGTLVIVPSGSKDEEVGVRVVGGITHEPDECAAYDYAGCIVARRQVRFNRHETLDLDIALTSECVGFGCDATRTCVAGQCAVLESAPAGAVVSAPLPDAGGPRVRCGDNGVFCPTSGNVCCLTVDRDARTSRGECKPPDDCKAPSIVLHCDDETDCADYAEGDKPGMCRLGYTNARDHFIPESVALSQCMSFASFVAKVPDGITLCQTRMGCIDNQFPCDESHGEPTNPLPGYFWCQIINP